MEAVAETSEEFMDRYFGGEEFTVDEIIDALRQNINEGNVVPVQCGSGSVSYTHLDVYKRQPCGSGKKYKFCCGK